MSRLVSFFNHCREEGWVTKLPTNGLRVRDPIANRDKRRAFTLAELHRVFGPGGSANAKGTITSSTAGGYSWRPEPEQKKRHSSESRTC
jgi:hypothetical protein